MASPPIPLHNRRMGTAWAPSPGSGATYTPRPFAHPRMSISASAATGGTPTFTLHSSPPPSAQQQQDQHHSSSPSASNVAPFRPSIAIVVGVLTTMFSITFLLLLYAKHCKRGSGARNGASGGGFSNSNLNGGAAPPRNSGIDRCVVESLPLFRFGVLLGQKAESSGGGLECAVCLNRFDPAELLRLLPKCKHAFHVECVDTWLDAHSTCPLCRCRVDPEDAFLIPAADPKLVPQPQAPPENDLRVSGSSRDGGDGDGSGEDGTLQRQQWDGERDGKPLCGSTGAEQLPEARGSPTGAADSVSSTNNYSGCAPFNILTGRASFSLSTLTGRHSSAGEKSSGAALLQVVVERPGKRKSIDDAILSNAAATARGPEPEQPLRRKDGLLLTTTDQLAGIPPSTKSVRNQEEVQRRFGHRILISSGNEGVPSPAGVSMQERRWSDLKPSDLLVLRREMILSAADSARYSASARARVSASSSTISSPSTAINGRCASEISGMSRLAAANRPVAIQEERERALRKKWQGFSAWRTGLWPTARGGGAGGGGNGPSR